MKETERLFFIPNELFVTDREAKANAPEALKDLPFYKLDDFMQRLPLAVQYGQITNRTVIPEIIRGNQGVIIRFSSSGKDQAIKIFRGSHVSEDQANILVESANTLVGTYDPWNRKEPKEYMKQQLLDQFGHTREDAKRIAIKEAAGANIAHALEPEFFPKPLHMWTKNGNVIGYSSMYLPAEFTFSGHAQLAAYPRSQEELDEARDLHLHVPLGNLLVDLSPEQFEANKIKRDRYEKAVQRVKDYGVELDQGEIGANFGVVMQNGELTIQVIDLSLVNLDLINQAIPRVMYETE